MSVTALAIAQGALWVVVLVMLLMVLGLMRQVGTLLERVSPAGISADKAAALAIGDAVPHRTLAGFSGANVAIGGALKDKAQLIVFVSPQCDVCKSISPMIARLSHSGRTRFTTTLAVAHDGLEDASTYAAASPDVEAVSAKEIASTFGAVQLPHVVIIREDGRLETSAPAASSKAFEELVAPLTKALNTPKIPAQSMESLA
ncbi:MAG: hypothetical protein AAF337_14475 [Pseudomonadota bacterium]